MTAFEQTLAWWRDGERVARATVDGIPDRGLGEPSLLPGWTRKTVLAHLAGNADALVNLLTWARTGVETPMYASAQAREAGIEQAAALPTGVLRAEFRLSQDRLAAAVDQLPPAAWAAQVRTAQGRLVPAAEVPWMRAREVWLHAVDLAGPAGLADIPPDVCAALIADIAGLWRDRGQVAELAGLLAWISGRSSGPPGPAPRWL
jgi:maleylpyruvate isomerase